MVWLETDQPISTASGKLGRSRFTRCKQNRWRLGGQREDAGVFHSEMLSVVAVPAAPPQLSDYTNGLFEHFQPLPSGRPVLTHYMLVEILSCSETTKEPSIHHSGGGR
jgi:hypothetical protein